MEQNDQELLSDKQNVINDTQICPVCGLSQTSWMDGNCPRCLLLLGTAIPSAEGPPSAPAADAVTDPVASRRLGDYELLEEIARGGMGSCSASDSKSHRSTQHNNHRINVQFRLQRLCSGHATLQHSSRNKLA